MGRYGTDREDDEVERHLAAKPAETRAPKAKSRRTITPDDHRRLDARTAIKKVMYENPRISTRELQTELARLGITLSTVAISNIKNQHRDSIKFLIGRGATHLKRLL